ncbi:conserved hypothetical protein [Cytophaga hutchinsonii ATCC 33406]|uniref:Subtilisin-like serine protease n=2 Tax=Cytophaga hutchinsonii TaxID=985 RepID=A0A6N4SR60_CYTH3|nr:conserved hypothetical protein [Cytophaga hutchinsonii ATCC 33406]
MNMALHKKLSFILFFIGSIHVYGQTNSYIIYLKDKNGTPGTIQQPSAYLSARSLERRHHEQIRIDSTDLPVSVNYLTAIKNEGASIVYSTKWLNAVHIKATESQYNTIRAFPFVLDGTGNFKVTQKSNAQEITAATQLNYAQNYTDYMGITDMHKQGVKGAGILIAVTDSGFPGVDTLTAFKHLWENNQITYFYDVADNEADVFNDGSHGTYILSVLAADTLVYKGVVPEASYVLLRTEVAATETQTEEFNWLRAAEIADSCGVDIISVSLGYTTYDDNTDSYTYADMDGQTSVIAAAADMAYGKGMIVVCSAGNDGNNAWKYIGTPADAKKVLAVGSVDFTNTKSGFSSIGPTADGRLKPDLCATGAGINCIKPDGTILMTGGTSLSTPMIAGMIAGIKQTYPSLSNDEVKNILLQSCDNYSNPTNLKGYGVPHFSRTESYFNIYINPVNSLIAPNPYHSGQLIIKVPEPEESYEIRMYDYQGQQVFEHYFFSSNNMISIENYVNNLQAGIYLIYVKSAYTAEIIKWIKL